MKKSRNMLSHKKQFLLCVLSAAISVTVILYVFKLYDNREDDTERHALFESTILDIVQLNLAIFFATLFSTSRSSILFVVDKVLNRKLSHTTLGLINISMKTICIVLFDFRIIHVGRTNQDTRLMILYADIASNCFSEACQDYAGDSKQQRSTCNKCCIKQREDKGKVISDHII